MNKLVNSMFSSTIALLATLFLTMAVPGTADAAGFKQFAKSFGKNGSLCLPVRGKIETQWSFENCASPVGSCTVGKVTRGGFLNGETSYTANGMALAAGIPYVEPDTTLSYAGDLTLNTRFGTLKFTDVGVLDQVTPVFSEFDRIVEGTGLFENATGTLFITGDVTATGFLGKIRGKVCISY